MTRPGARARRLVLLFLSASALVTTAGTGGAVAVPVRPADSVPIVVDRQGDAFDLPLPSTYTPTRGDSYVGIVAGQQESHALVHLDLSSFHDLARTEKVLLSVGRDPADSGNELQAGGAALQACVVHGTWSSGREPTDAVVDCHTAVAAVASGPDAFTFDLTPFLSLWQSAREDGIALVPVADPTASWRISLQQTRTTGYAVMAPVPSPANVVTSRPLATAPLLGQPRPPALSMPGALPGTGVALTPLPPLSTAVAAMPTSAPSAAPLDVSSPAAEAAITVAAAEHGSMSVPLSVGLTVLAALLGFAAPVHFRRRPAHPAHPIARSSS